MSEICSTCRFWVPKGWTTNDRDPKVATYGECHRFPPQVVVDGKGKIAVFSTTTPGLGCGEHSFAVAFGGTPRKGEATATARAVLPTPSMTPGQITQG